MKKVTIEMSETQARIVLTAVEEWFRLRMGQPNDLANSLAMLGYDRNDHDREKMIELLDHKVDDDWYTSEEIADYLLANGVTFTPAIPGPSESDPNIMELCFRNGENHMRDKIKTSLLKMSADMPCVPISQVIKIMEDL